MNIRAVAYLAWLAFALALPSGASMAQGAQYKNGQDLVGTWSLTATIDAGAPICPAGCSAPALSTVMSDGTLIQSAPLSGTGAGHGVWRRTGLRTFKAVAYYFRTDPASGAFLGTSESLIDATVDKSGRQLTGTFTAVIRLPDQTLVTNYGGTISGTRVELP